MQERPYDPSEPKASPWEVYVFEEGCWVSLQTFGDEDEARAYLQNSVNQSGFPADYYAVIGPNDQVMPPAPASYSPEGDY